MSGAGFAYHSNEGSQKQGSLPRRFRSKNLDLRFGPLSNAACLLERGQRLVVFFGTWPNTQMVCNLDRRATWVKFSACLAQASAQSLAPEPKIIMRAGEKERAGHQESGIGSKG